MRESRLSRILPAVLGGLLVLEAIALLMIACFSLIIGSLVGMLAFVGGAGAATDKQILQGFAMIAVTLASPFVVAGAVGLGGSLLLIRKGRAMIVLSAVLAIAAQVVFHLVIPETVSAKAVIPLVLQGLAIVVALTCVRSSAAPLSNPPLTANP
jgi:hypothetical protein